MPDGPGSGLAVTSTVCQPSSAARRATVSTASARSCGIADHAARAHAILADLELRLHHGNDIGVGRRARRQCGQHCGQRDERQVGDHQVDRAADRVGRQIAHVGALHHGHARIGAQRPGQLAVADVDGDHLAGAAVEQDLGEPAGRGAGVQAASAVDGQPEGVQCADEFVGATRHPAAFVGVFDRERGADGDRRRGLGGGHAVDADPACADQLGGLLAGAGQPAPHQLGVNTCPPRHERSPLLDRLERLHQQFVRLLEPRGDDVDLESASSSKPEPSCAGSGRSASNAAILARIWSGSVLMSVFTLVDCGG